MGKVSPGARGTSEEERSSAAAVPPAPFSWDVVPTYSFPCYAPNDRQVGGPFTPADIELLLRFPVVVLCHGYFNNARALVRALSDGAVATAAEDHGEENSRSS